jgi:hypothetical protein
MTAFNPRVRSITLSWLLVGLFGALEGFYGRTQYFGDWISYLNVSRAVSRLDWKAIFDPMWSPGYPALVALARGTFAPTPEGEWYAIFLLNWLIFLCAYASWRYLLRGAAKLYNTASALTEDPAAVWITCFAFLSFGLCFDRVSRVSPDLLVSTLFILAAAQVLSLLSRPSIRRAVILGVILGAGYWVKNVFLSFGCIFLLILLLACVIRKTSWHLFVVSSATFLALALPFISAISWSYGQFTLGASGSLNYAFHVNHLPHWTNWQGGPSEFGSPAHPTRQLLPDLPVFEFAQPFQSTYPPYNNMAYWYQGFRHFFSLKDQAAAILRSLYFLVRVVLVHPFLYALSFALLVALLKKEWRTSLLKAAVALWPLFLAALLGISTYLLVHVEDRYLASFLLIISLLALLYIFDLDLRSKRRLSVFLVAVFAVGTAAELAVVAGPTFRAALHRNDYRMDAEWRLASALRSRGFKSGDAVALIGDERPNYLCSWAYLSELRIVAEFGSLPWHLEPWDRTKLDGHHTEVADRNYGRVFWNLSPADRERVVEKFHDTGARAIVSLENPPSNVESGWQHLGGSDAWIYSFDSSSVDSARSLPSAVVGNARP